jgi:hypothetical protein
MVLASVRACVLREGRESASSGVIRAIRLSGAESTMSTTPQFAIPNEMRALAERSVEQAKVAFQQLMQAAEEAVSTLDERSETSQVDALDIAKKAMTLAERNVLSAFELAQKSLRLRTSSNWSGCKPSSFSRRCKPWASR